ncbi:flagellin, partial [Anaerobiospirillum succiniciproducens]|uniref:flagellin n=1 Tax=Anaerobiospirillum succiniciproducens TaxID=13335 RepID=UPI003F8C67AD
AGKAGTVTLQVGSNKGDTISFTVENMQFSKIGSRADAKFADKVGQNKLMKIDGGNITFQFSVADPTDAIKLMDDMIAQTDSARAGLGAMQNRLESSIRNQSNVAANEADARSRIRDADFAEESANLTQQNIIQQAAASMLMQANTRPQLGLSLLG